MTPLALTDAALAVVLGVGFGAGVCLLASLLPRWGTRSLSRRLAPYVRDVADPAGLTPARLALGETLGSSAALWDDLRSRWSRMVGGSESVSRRLGQAGWAMDAAGFRGRQLGAMVIGLAAGGALAVAMVLMGRASPALAALPAVFAAAAMVLCDAVLSRAARIRLARVREELPTVLEFVALCLAAGEGLFDALRRVAAVGAGELTGEFRSVVVAVDTGSNLGDALRALGERVQLAPLSRALDQVVVALDAGAPLAHVLQAQAGDARDEEKRSLIEQAGRKEILMLVPLVFLILPLSVVFAIFPGVFMLRLGVG